MNALIIKVIVSKEPGDPSSFVPGYGDTNKSPIRDAAYLAVTQSEIQ